MNRKLAMSLALVVGILMVCGVTLAHHGQSVYDENNPIVLRGTVTSFLWANPHCLVNLDVKDEKGSVVHWIAETVNPGKLARAGWTKDSLKPGDDITVTLTPAKNGAHLCIFTNSCLPMEGSWRSAKNAYTARVIPILTVLRSNSEESIRRLSLV